MGSEKHVEFLLSVTMKAGVTNGFIRRMWLIRRSVILRSCLCFLPMGGGTGEAGLPGIDLFAFLNTTKAPLSSLWNGNWHAWVR